MEPQLAAKPAGTAQRGRASHPPTLQMVKEALQAHDEKKGASVVAIKRFILAKYPMVDPIRLKYLLKQALSKGLSCGELVRPRNSSCVGATGIYKLARKKPLQKQQLGQADPERGKAPKPGQKGTTKAPRGALAGAQQQGAVKQQPTATKQKPKAKPAQPQAAEKPGSDKAKHSQAAERPRARARGTARSLGAASHRQAPRKGHSGPSTALAAENAGGGESDSSAGAGVKGPQKAPKGKSKGKVAKGAKDAPKAQAGSSQARKPRVTPEAGQGKTRLKKAAPAAGDRKAP